MELDAAVIMESINKGINHDVIGVISSNRKLGLVYNSEIVTLKFTNQIFIESVCFAQVDTLFKNVEESGFKSLATLKKTIMNHYSKI